LFKRHFHRGAGRTRRFRGCCCRPCARCQSALVLWEGDPSPKAISAHER
jgi:hypothetical protein